MSKTTLIESKAESTFTSFVQRFRLRAPDFLLPRLHCTADVLDISVESISDKELARLTMISCLDIDLGTLQEKVLSKRVMDCISKKSERDLRNLPVSRVSEKGSVLKQMIFREISADRVVKVVIKQSDVFVTLVDDQADPKFAVIVSIPMFHNCFVSIEVGLTVEGEAFSFSLDDFLGYPAVFVPGPEELDWLSLIRTVKILGECFVEFRDLNAG